MSSSHYGNDSGARRAVDPIRLAAEREAKARRAQDAQVRHEGAFRAEQIEDHRKAGRAQAQHRQHVIRLEREAALEVADDMAWDAYADAKFDEELQMWKLSTLVEQDEARFAAEERARLNAPRGVRPYHDLDTVMAPTPGYHATNPEEAYEAMSAQLDALETREHDLQRIMERCLEPAAAPTLFGVPPVKAGIPATQVDSFRLPLRMIGEYARETMGGHNSYNARPYMGRDSVAQSEMNQELFERASVIAATSDAVAASIDHLFDKGSRAGHFSRLAPPSRKL